MGYNDPIPEVTPKERERNLNRSLDEVWADADESRMDKALETGEKLAKERREREEESSSGQPDSLAAP